MSAKSQQQVLSYIYSHCLYSIDLILTTVNACKILIKINKKCDFVLLIDQYIFMDISRWLLEQHAVVKTFKNTYYHVVFCYGNSEARFMAVPMNTNINLESYRYDTFVFIKL